MTGLIIVFGALILLAGIVILINPNLVFGLINKQAESLGLHVLAVVVRLLLGVALITQSGDSRYPLAIEIIGWLSIVAAASFAVIGRNRFKRLISWGMSVAKPFARIGGVAAVCFGAFLVHGFV